MALTVGLRLLKIFACPKKIADDNMAASVCRLQRVFRGLSVCSSKPSQHFARSISTNRWPLLFRLTPVVSAEPLKKKKRVDPSLAKKRDERKRKRIEKEIRKLEKTEKQLKPIDEMEVHPKLLKEKSVRTRQVAALTQEEKDNQISLKKEWSLYKRDQFSKEINRINCIVKSQNRALAELRAESEELYREAVQLDPTLLPFETKGPVRTPPLKHFESADGVFIDTTRKWE